MLMHLMKCQEGGKGLRVIEILEYDLRFSPMSHSSGIVENKKLTKRSRSIFFLILKNCIDS